MWIMGLFDFFADRSKAKVTLTGRDFQEKQGPFGERQRKGQYFEYSQKNTNQGIFNLFKQTPQIQGKKDQKRLK
jgi:hypothetical protein